MSSTNSFYLRPKQRPQEPTSYDIVNPAKPLGKIYPGKVMTHLSSRNINVPKTFHPVETHFLPPSKDKKIQGPKGGFQNEIKSIVGPTGPVGPRGQKGLPGKQGPPGVSESMDWVQIYEENHENIITSSNRYLQLTKNGVNNNFKRGDFHMKTEINKNDTLFLPSVGNWLVSINFKYSYQYNLEDSGKSICPTFDVLCNNNVVFSFKETATVGNNDSLPVYEKFYSASFVIYSMTIKPKLKMRYTDGFDFSFASDNQLKVSQFTLFCQKL